MTRDVHGDEMAVQGQAERERTTRSDSLGKRWLQVLIRAWVQATLRLSTISPVFAHLATLTMGPYKDKREILRYAGQLSYISPRAQVKCARLQLGPRCFIDDYVTIYAHPTSEGKIVMKGRTHIYRWSVVELGQGNGSVHIGANTFIQSGCVLNAFVGSISIGDECMIAPHCSFMPYQHSFGDRGRPMREQPFASHGDIVIQDDVWLGVNVCVLENVTIGQGAIVGAGAVVTSDIPPYAIAAGVPARVLRWRDAEGS
jgi:acetyltransferase-like isoleucine patch superfamily enzyme